MCLRATLKRKNVSADHNRRLKVSLYYKKSSFSIFLSIFNDVAGRTNTSGGPRVWDPCVNYSKNYKVLFSINYYSLKVSQNYNNKLQICLLNFCKFRPYIVCSNSQGFCKYFIIVNAPSNCTSVFLKSILKNFLYFYRSINLIQQTGYDESSAPDSFWIDLYNI